MTSISELRLVSGMTPLIYNRISPYLVALPANTTLNIQTAPPVIVQASGQQSKNTQATGPTQVSSQYYLLRADVYLNDQHFVLYSLLTTNNTGSTTTPSPNTPPVTVLWQSFGTP